MWQNITVYGIGIFVLYMIIRKIIYRINLIKKKERCTGCPSCKTCNQKKIYNLDNKNIKYCSKNLNTKNEKK